MQEDRPDISVVIPAFCEETGIEATVRAVHSHLSSGSDSFEIIVVDNASPDATAARAMSTGLSNVTVLVNDSNMGKGYSVRRGMHAASGALKLHCDADCAPSLESLAAMRALVTEGSDVVVGSRLASGAEIGQRQPLLRRIAGSSFQTLCRVILGEPTRDRFCGFKLWTCEAADAVFPDVSLDGWVFDAEALALARRLGLTVTETGIVWADRDGSRLSMIRVLIPVTRELLRARASVNAVSAQRRSRESTQPASRASAG